MDGIVYLFIVLIQCRDDLSDLFGKFYGIALLALLDTDIHGMLCIDGVEGRTVLIAFGNGCDIFEVECPARNGQLALQHLLCIFGAVVGGEVEMLGIALLYHPHRKDVGEPGQCGYDTALIQPIGAYLLCIEMNIVVFVRIAVNGHFGNILEGGDLVFEPVGSLYDGCM